MNGNVIDGKAVASQIKAELREEITSLKERYGRVRRQGYEHAVLVAW